MERMDQGRHLRNNSRIFRGRRVHQLERPKGPKQEKLCGLAPLARSDS